MHVIIYILSKLKDTWNFINIKYMFIAYILDRLKVTYKFFIFK